MKLFKRFFLVALCLCLAGCSYSNSTSANPTETCVSSMPSSDAFHSDPPSHETRKPEKVSLPMPCSEMFGLEGTDATIYTAFVDWYSWRGGEDSDSLLIPTFSILDTYDIGDDTYYTGWFYMLDYYGLAYGLMDINSPKYTLNLSSLLCRVILHKNTSGEIESIEIDEYMDGAIWENEIKRLCGPNKTLAEQLCNDLGPTLETRDLTTHDPSKVLNIYLNYFFP